MEFDDDRDDDRRADIAMEIAKRRWEVEFKKNDDRSKIKYDDWLEVEAFQRAIENCQTPIIDLGCGKGSDTLYLIERGKKVIPCDCSSSAIENIRKNFTEEEVERTECFDMTRGLPFDDNFTDLIICGLSLHYFTEKKTFEILKEIKRVLKPGGIILFRVNSVKDVNYGAGKGKEIETHLYETSDGRYKRFFDREDIEKFFADADWEKQYIQEYTTGYKKALVDVVGKNVESYDIDKVVWRGAMKVRK